MSLILTVAISNERIRMVLLNGSRANPNAAKDIFQDYDIIYIVRDIKAFKADHSWIDIFGKRLILQMPDDMVMFDGNDDKNKNETFAYLMLFEDGSRIDLTLYPIEKITTQFNPGSLCVLLLDKDNLFPDFPLPADKDYLIKKPGEKEFSDCCNEFWWVSTYIAKGLWRGDITYAKDILENPVRKMFMKMIEWHIGAATMFTISFGKSGKNMRDNIDQALWNKILTTYPDAEPGNIWNSLFIMTDIFRELAVEIADNFQFKYNSVEDKNIVEYLKKVMDLAKQKNT